ncbi:hypothetical protein Tco_1560802, partial [Tanacetum coccineum]
MEFYILTELLDCSYEARAELLDHNKLLKLMQFLMGLDDIYQPIRSSLLTGEILLEVNDAFVIVARDESHRGIPPTFMKNDKPQASAFVSKTNDNRRNNNGNGILETREIITICCVKFVGNFVVNNDIKTTTGTLSFTNDQVMKLVSLLNEKSGSSAHANIA